MTQTDPPTEEHLPAPNADPASSPSPSPELQHHSKRRPSSASSTSPPSSPTKKVKAEPITETINFDTDDDEMEVDPVPVTAAKSVKNEPIKDEQSAAGIAPPISVKSETAGAVPTKETGGGGHLDPQHFQAMLKIFYERFFPFQEVYRWLSYGNVQKNYFANREWSFTLANEIYVRFQSFKDAQALRDEVVKAVPVKMDIGAVYNIAPKEKKSVSAASFKPMERELVFDIDMTDYDEIRTCCSGGSVCHKCWEFMTVAIKILDRALREDFGFKHLLWVYSGRRGVHCWVSDSRARKLTGDQRRAIVSFLEVIKGGAEQGAGRRVNLGRTLHPSLGAAQKVVEEYFERTVLKGMNCMRTPEQIEKLVGFVQDADVIARFQQEMASRPGPTSLQTWQILVSLLNAPGKKSSGKFFPPNTERDIQFLYIYPRLDSHVSIGLNHLLKAPFCVHPKTGRVCVPINPATCESFDPIGSVGVEELVEAGDGKGLAPHISYFRQFLNGLGEEIRMERGVDLTF